MSRPVFVFLGAVLIPSLALGGLALRAMKGQEALIERERNRLYESATEHLAQSLAARIDEQQRDFSLRVESLLGKLSPAALAPEFDTRLRERWPMASVGFAVSLNGQLLSPYILGSPDARDFLVRNEGFLCKNASVEVFAVTPKGRINLAQLDTAQALPARPEGGPSTVSNPKTGHAKFVQLVGLLQFFFAHAGEVLSRDRLLNEVWSQRYLGTTRTLDQVIVQLRKKLGDSADAPRHLLTVHGVGYKLVPG